MHNNNDLRIIYQFIYSLRSRRLEVVGERENGHARGRHARGEGAPARKAPENRFNSHSVSADVSNCREAPEGKTNRAGRENCQSIVHGQHSEDLTLHYTTSSIVYNRSSGLGGHFSGTMWL